MRGQIMIRSQVGCVSLRPIWVRVGRVSRGETGKYDIFLFYCRNVWFPPL